MLASWFLIIAYTAAFFALTIFAASLTKRQKLAYTAAFTGLAGVFVVAFGFVVDTTIWILTTYI
jgi:hypothetical protein